MAVFINEWLPNPAGPDAGGEWLEIYNDGKEAVSLSGWQIQNGSGKKAKLGNVWINPGEYIVLYRGDTKLVLRNRDEVLSLYNTRRELVHRAEFLGSVPEGKSISRTDNYFMVTEPTPGAANAANNISAILDSNPPGVPLNSQLASSDVIGLSLGWGILICAVAFFAIKNHGSLSQLFFGRNEKISQTFGSEDLFTPGNKNKIPF